MTDRTYDINGTADGFADRQPQLPATGPVPDQDRLLTQNKISDCADPFPKSPPTS